MNNYSQKKTATPNYQFADQKVKICYSKFITPTHTFRTKNVVRCHNNPLFTLHQDLHSSNKWIEGGCSPDRTISTWQSALLIGSWVLILSSRLPVTFALTFSPLFTLSSLAEPKKCRHYNFLTASWRNDFCWKMYKKKRISPTFLRVTAILCTNFSCRLCWIMRMSDDFRVRTSIARQNTSL